MTLRFAVLLVSFFLGLLSLLFWVQSSAADNDDEMRALAHSRLPVQLLLNQGTALLYGPVRRDLEAPGPEGLRAFAGMNGGRQEVSDNGRVKVDGYSFMAGLGQRFTIDDDLPLAAFTYGFFAEGGTGRFDISGTLGADVATKGEGRGRYVGGGFLLRTEFQNNFYIDGAFRTGQATTSLEALEPGGPPADSSNVYFGAASGLGWRAPVGDWLELDAYGRLNWSHQGSGQERNSIKIAEINSTRAVFGSRAGFRVGEGRLIYAGAAWEHGFNGRAELTRHSKPLPGPFTRLEGDSLVGEMGLELAGGGGFSATVGLEAAFGTREALGGILRLGYEF
jgi:hypothetical protein